MRKVLYVGLVTLMETLASVCQAAPGDELFVQASDVNLRQYPSLEAAVLTRLDQGTKVVEVRREGDWVRIRSKEIDEKEGYVHGSLLRSAPPGDGRAARQPTDERILNLTWDISKKLEQALREIDKLNDQVSHLERGLIRLESKLDRLRQDTRF